MNRGYVKLWRKSLDAGWIKNHKLWAFWTYCLMKASHKEFDAIVGLQIIHLMPGQFIFGLKKTSEEIGLSIQETRTILTLLKKAGNLTIKTTNKFSIISIVNWPIYQSEEIENNTLPNKPLTNEQQHTRTITHKENIYSPNSNEIRISELLFNLISKRDPKVKKPNFQKWAVHIDRLIRIDNRSPDEIEKVIYWCQEDSFWQNNILSTEKLRKKFQQLFLKSNEERPLQKAKAANVW